MGGARLARDIWSYGIIKHHCLRSCYLHRKNCAASRDTELLLRSWTSDCRCKKLTILSVIYRTMFTCLGGPGRRLSTRLVFTVTGVGGRVGDDVSRSHWPRDIFAPLSILCHIPITCCLCHQCNGICRPCAPCLDFFTTSKGRNELFSSG